jgi:hypothetical protein
MNVLPLVVDALETEPSGRATEALEVNRGLGGRGVIAFRTMRDGKPRTVGLIIVGPHGSAATAANAAQRWHVPQNFQMGCTAFGKVVFLDIERAAVQAFQLSNNKAEQVWCGNAYAAAAGFAALYIGCDTVSLVAKRNDRTVDITAAVKRPVEGRASIEALWRIRPRCSDFVFEPGQEPVAGVSVLNTYQFTVGPKLTRAIEVNDCTKKHCRIIPGEIAEVQVSTCGRIHGAIPQTGALSLQIARLVFTFIQAAVPTDTIKHAAGVERLPVCRWQGGEFVATMPITGLELVEAVKR